MSTKKIGADLAIVLSATLQVESQNRDYGLPVSASIIEAQLLAPYGHPNRALVLWMLRPQKHPREDPSDFYTCPEATRGSYYSGPTRVSLINLETSRIINTIKVHQDYFDREDTFDIPFKIRSGYFYSYWSAPRRCAPAHPHGRRG
ncbi:MAG: hypothetical protein ACREDR_16440 [Blastocatellia bacterium]